MYRKEEEEEKVAGSKDQGMKKENPINKFYQSISNLFGDPHVHFFYLSGTYGDKRKVAV